MADAVANGSRRRMYLPTSAFETCPVFALIRQAGVPALEALVTKPARRECPEYRVGSRPIDLARCLTMDDGVTRVDQAVHVRAGSPAGTPVLR
jgi:hypothetical protein